MWLQITANIDVKAATEPTCHQEKLIFPDLMGKKQKAKAEQQAQKKQEEGRQHQNGIKPASLTSADEKILAECESAVRDFTNGSRSARFHSTPL